MKWEIKPKGYVHRLSIIGIFTLNVRYRVCQRYCEMQTCKQLAFFFFFPFSVEKMKRTLSSSWRGGFVGKVRIECGKCFSP